MALKKRDLAVKESGVSAGIVGGPFALRFPLVWEMLAVGVYPDGSTRRLATITLFVDTDTVKACLNDRDQGLTAFASGQGFMEAIDALEAGLRSDTLEWKRAFIPQKKSKKST